MCIIGLFPYRLLLKRFVCTHLPFLAAMEDKDPIFYIGLHDGGRSRPVTAATVAKLHESNVSLLSDTIPRFPG